MRNAQPAPGQTIWDIALQHMGSAESVFEILQLNPDLRPDDVFTEDSSPIILPAKSLKPLVVAWFENSGIVPISKINDVKL